MRAARTQEEKAGGLKEPPACLLFSMQLGCSSEGTPAEQQAQLRKLTELLF
jgi:hypothetical protein